jgi:hypothetical protein
MAWENQRNKELEKQMEREFLRVDQDRIRRLEIVRTQTDLSAAERAVAAEHEQSLSSVSSSSSNVRTEYVDMPTALRPATHHDSGLSTEERAFAAEHEYEQSLRSAPSSSSNVRTEYVNMPTALRHAIPHNSGLIHRPRPYINEPPAFLSLSSSSNVPMRNANMPTAQRTATRHDSGVIHSLRPYINVPPAFLRQNWRPSTEQEASFGTVGLGAIGEASGSRQSTKSAQPASSSAVAATSPRELLSGSVEDVPSTHTTFPISPPRPSSTTSSVGTAFYRPSQPQAAVGVHASPPVSSSNASSSGLPQPGSAAIPRTPTPEPQPIEDALAASVASSVTLVCTPVTPVQSSSIHTPTHTSTSTSPPTPTHDVDVQTMRLYHNLQSTYADYLRWYSSTTVPEDQDALAQNCCCVINRFLEEFTSKKSASRWDWEADFVAERTLYSLMYRRWSATQPELAASSPMSEEEEGTPKLTASSLSGEVEGADRPNDLSKEDLKHRRSLPSIFCSRLTLHEELRTALFDRRNYFNELAYVGFELYVEKLEKLAEGERQGLS